MTTLGKDKSESKVTHEQYISEVRDIVASRQPSDVQDRLLACKLIYGIGDGSYRGICYYSKWQNGQPAPLELVEVAASGEEHPIQLAGTTIHELAHVLAGNGHGHDKTWKQECDKLGLRLAMAAGHDYMLASLHPEIRSQIAKLASRLQDGKPTFAGTRSKTPKPCSLGIGTRGGTSRGAGSGSRMRLYECKCDKPVKVRVASDEFKAHCDLCHEPFVKVDKPAPSNGQIAGLQALVTLLGGGQ
jgi:hypothetical protein